jgi:FtsH-binding integral membrane protein
MNMDMSRFAFWLLSRTRTPGTRDALVGDLMEEIVHGRSSWWVCQELVGLYGVAFLARARQTVRMTPLVVALAVAALLVGGASIASPHYVYVLQTWLILYYVAGTMSLFAHVMSRTMVSRTLPIGEEADEH